MRIFLTFLTLILTTNAMANEHIGTAQAGNASHWLVNDARCEEMMEIVRTSGMKSDRDGFALIAFINFVEGFAAARDQTTDQVIRDLMVWCIDNPNKKVSSPFK